MKNLDSLTENDIESLKEGKELDAMVAIARGWIKEKNSDDLYSWVWADEEGELMHNFDDWCPSEDIEYAWELVSELRLKVEPKDDELWLVSKEETSASNSEICLAICQCYLKCSLLK